MDNRWLLIAVMLFANSRAVLQGNPYYFDRQRVELPQGFYLTDALNEYALRFLKESLAGEKLFFLYVAHTYVITIIMPGVCSFVRAALPDAQRDARGIAVSFSLLLGEIRRGLLAKMLHRTVGRDSCFCPSDTHRTGAG